MKNKKGFTLIELLAVIVILGILLSISIVAVNKIRKNQEEENRKNVIKSILTGAKEYTSEHRNVLNRLPNEISVSVLKNGDGENGSYIDFDEVKYSDLLDTKVSISTCGDKSGLKLKYSIGNYDDCGCETQNEEENPRVFCDARKSCVTVIEDDGTETTKCSGWDSKGKYYTCSVDEGNNKAIICTLSE